MQNIKIKDDAQVSINKGNLTPAQQSTLEECRRSLINTMNTIPWYDRIFHDEGYANLLPVGLMSIIEFFNSDNEEKKQAALETIKFYIQDADWHTKPRAAKRRVDRNFNNFYYTIVEQYNLINEGVLMAIITRLYQLYKNRHNEL